MDVVIYLFVMNCEFLSDIDLLFVNTARLKGVKRENGGQ